jgi:hypothetical protein
MLNFVPFGENFYSVYFNSVGLGDIDKDVDGYYYFWRNESLHGSESAYILRAIADKLDELNKPWDEEIAAYFKAEEERDNLIPCNVCGYYKDTPNHELGCASHQLDGGVDAPPF